MKIEPCADCGLDWCGATCGRFVQIAEAKEERIKNAAPDLLDAVHFTLETLRMCQEPTKHNPLDLVVRRTMAENKLLAAYLKATGETNP